MCCGIVRITLYRHSTARFIALFHIFFALPLFLPIAFYHTPGAVGGCGCAAALGVRFLDEAGKAFIPVGRTLERIAHIDKTGLAPALAGVEIVTMCDIDNPLCGPNGAAAVFGPQKGADGPAVERLDRGLHHLAEVVRADLDVEILDLSLIHI